MIYAKLIATARPRDRLNGFKNGKTQLFYTSRVVKWDCFQKKWCSFNTHFSALMSKNENSTRPLSSNKILLISRYHYKRWQSASHVLAQHSLTVMSQDVLRLNGLVAGIANDGSEIFMGWDVSWPYESISTAERERERERVNMTTFNHFTY